MGAPRLARLPGLARLPQSLSHGKAVAERAQAGVLAYMLVLSLVIPPAVTLPMQSPKITATRAILLLTLIPAFLTLVRGIGNGTRHLRFSDYTMALCCICMFTAYTVTEGFSVAVVSANLIIMELLGGYILARAYFCNRVEIQAVVRALTVAVIFTVCVAVVDHFLHQNWVNDTISLAFGVTPIESQYRNGVLRAMSTTEHAILFGTFCVMSAGVLYFGRTSARGGITRLAICALGCILAMSSAPLLALMVLVASILYDKLLNAYPWRWRLFALGFFTFVVILCVVSRNPLEALLSRFTLEPQTAFYRLLIWEYAGAEVLNSPLFGIGLRDWARMPGMVGSVNSMWLSQAMSFGIPASFMLGLTLISSTWRTNRPPPPPEARDRYLEQIRTGLTIVLMLVIFIGFTVHLWGTMMTFLGLLIGLRTTIEEVRSGPATKKVDARQKRVAWPAGAGAHPLARPHLIQARRATERARAPLQG